MAVGDNVDTCDISWMFTNLYMELNMEILFVFQNLLETV
jgi:hypothetical protein